MLIKTQTLNRRRVLRGMVGGGAVAVSLPFLDCFLNDNGTALAATNAPLPTRFGTWFWGLGMNGSVFIPKKVGADFDLPEEIAALKDVKQHINLTVYRPTVALTCAIIQDGWRFVAELPRRGAMTSPMRVWIYPFPEQLAPVHVSGCLILLPRAIQEIATVLRAVTLLIQRKYRRWTRTVRFSVRTFRTQTLRPFLRIPEWSSEKVFCREF